MLLSNTEDDPESKEQDIDLTSLPLNEALQVSLYKMMISIVYYIVILYTKRNLNNRV